VVRDFIDKLLTLDSSKRLGAGGPSEVKDHPFFDGIIWDDLLTEEAAFVPQSTDMEDTEYFSIRNRTLSITHIEEELSGRVPLTSTFQSEGLFGKFQYKK